MSVAAPSMTTPGAFLCPRCGTALRDAQGWCVECGLAARTRVHPPPSWRIPIVATLVAVALLAAGIAVTLVVLLDTTEPTPAPATVTIPASTPAPGATTAPAATAPATVPPLTTTPTTVPPATTTPTTTTPPGAVPGGAAAPGG